MNNLNYLEFRSLVRLLLIIERCGYISTNVLVCCNLMGRVYKPKFARRASIQLCSRNSGKSDGRCDAQQDVHTSSCRKHKVPRQTFRKQNQEHTSNPADGQISMAPPEELKILKLILVYADGGMPLGALM